MRVGDGAEGNLGDGEGGGLVGVEGSGLVHERLGDSQWGKTQFSYPAVVAWCLCAVKSLGCSLSVLHEH